jgi:hypothetical protein
LERLWRNYSLSITLFLLFLGAWIIQTVSGWIEFASEQAQHEQEAEVFGPGGYVWLWLESTMENWQSEFLQLFTFVVLTTFLIHRGSHESKDSSDRLERKIDEIRQRLAKVEGG